MVLSAQRAVAVAVVVAMVAETAAIHRASVELTEDTFNDKIAGKTVWGLRSDLQTPLRPATVFLCAG